VKIYNWELVPVRSRTLTEAFIAIGETHDGRFIRTSPVMRREGNTITTRSGSTYELIGEPNREPLFSGTPTKRDKP